MPGVPSINFNFKVKEFKKLYFIDDKQHPAQI
jgi:hypothetical protein